MSKEQPVIQIQVIGTVGVGKSTIAYLLADFLSHTGFKTELNLLDNNNEIAQLEKMLPEQLEIMEQRGTKIVITEVQAVRANGL